MLMVDSLIGFLVSVLIADRGATFGKKPTRATKNEGSKVALRAAKTYAHLNVRPGFYGTGNEHRNLAKRRVD